MIARPLYLEAVSTALQRSPVTALLGPRQCGKTTLARQFVPPNSLQYFDLENPRSLARLVEPDTVLVSIMHINNEIGVIQDIAAIAAVCAAHGTARLHVDAAQSIGKCPLDFSRQGVDLLSLSAHKSYGPKGAGFLFLRSGIPIEPIHFGGAHENQRRAGTENVAALGEATRFPRLDQDSLCSRSKKWDPPQCSPQKSAPREQIVRVSAWIHRPNDPRRPTGAPAPRPNPLARRARRRLLRGRRYLGGHSRKRRPGVVRAARLAPGNR
jgi:hypothetical protein